VWQCEDSWCVCVTVWGLVVCVCDSVRTHGVCVWQCEDSWCVCVTMWGLMVCACDSVRTHGVCVVTVWGLMVCVCDSVRTRGVCACDSVRTRGVCDSVRTRGVCVTAWGLMVCVCVTGWGLVVCVLWGLVVCVCDSVRTHDVVEVFDGELWKAQWDEILFAGLNQRTKPSQSRTTNTPNAHTKILCSALHMKLSSKMLGYGTC